MELAGIPERQIETAGCWAGMGIRGYPDTPMSDARKMGARKITRLLVFLLFNAGAGGSDGELPHRTSRADAAGGKR